MKLSDLRSAIRAHSGNPSVTVELVPGVPMTLVPQKTALLKSLGDAYGDQRTAETGLTFTNGYIMVEGRHDVCCNEPIDDGEDDLL